MGTTISERRQIENEMIFRRRNEKVSSSISTLDAMHINDGNRHLVHDEDYLLQFICECSDENCDVRIPMMLSAYDKIHADRNRFIIVPDHQVDTIEKIVKKTANYYVVRKERITSEPSGGLNETDVNNS